MKELKYNLQVLFKRKELYLTTIILFLISGIQIYLVVQRNLQLTYNSNNIIENTKTAEYLYILYNNDILLNSLVILAFPILVSTIFSDSFWVEKHNNILVFLCPRLNYKKNVYSQMLITFFISFLLVFLSLMVNYLVLRYIFGSGNFGDQQASLPFLLKSIPGFFLDSIRLQNPALFTVLCITHVSILCGLISLLCYSLSFFIKNKIILFAQSIIFIIFMEIICTVLNIGSLLIIKQMQVMSAYSMIHIVILYLFLLTVSIISVQYSLSKRRCLL